MGDAPKYQLPLDPNLVAQQDQATQDTTNALTMKATQDSASVMARYGTRLAMAGATSGTPMAVR